MGGVETVLTYCMSLRNGFTMGLLYLALGFKCYLINEDKPSKRILIVTLIIGVIMHVFETTAVFYASDNNLADDGSLFLSQLIVVPALLLLLLQTQIELSDVVSLRLRNLSTGMYLLHAPLIFMLEFVIFNDIILFFVVLFSSYMICVLSYKTHFLHLDKLLK